jgi:hypothetical protein
MTRSPIAKTGHAFPEAFDLARAFEAEDRAQAADRAMLMAGEHKKIGTVERGGLHAHANFAGDGRRGFGGVALFFSLTRQSFSSLSPQLAQLLPAINVRAKRADGLRYALDDKHCRDQPGLQRARTGLHADQAARQIVKTSLKLLPCTLQFQNNRTALIEAHQMEAQVACAEHHHSVFGWISRIRRIADGYCHEAWGAAVAHIAAQTRAH